MLSGMTAKKNTAPGPGEMLHPASLDGAIARSLDSLLSSQNEDGHWVFDLEADATIPAEYILLQHYLGTIEQETRARQKEIQEVERRVVQQEEQLARQLDQLTRRDGEIQSRTVSGGSTNSSATVTPRGLRALGRSAISTRSGTITVRDQYEILSM